MRKIYIVPNLVTTGNMFCGFYSVIAAIHTDFITAAWAIVVASIFDALDGRVARLARATSQFGVEYDSLSDLVSFGVAPAVLFYFWALQPYGRLGWIIAFLFLVCGALRLARFNVSAEMSPKGYFQGAPIPLAANAVATFVVFNEATGWPDSGQYLTQGFTLAMSVVFSALMVSTVPFPSFKELNWRSKATFGYLLLGLIIIVLIALNPDLTLFLLIVTYVLGSLIWLMIRSLLGRSSIRNMPRAEQNE